MEKIERRVRSLKEEDASGIKVSLEKLNDYGLTDITLRSYQLDGINWLINCYHSEHGCILGDEMGLGKTCQTISLLVYLVGSKEGVGPHLILSPLSVLNNWKTELARFAPHLEVLTYVGDKNAREELRKSFNRRSDEVHVVLTTYEICLKDETFLKKYSWHTLVVDEAHRLKNRESLLHQALSEFDVAHSVLLTGTPVQNNLKELYALLHFIIPELFKVKYTEDFLETFNNVQTNSNKMTKLHDLLLPFILRRVKSQVIKDLPEKSELILFHGMTALQKEYYKAILMKDTSIFKTLSNGTRTKLMNVLMQLRKCVNHPYLFEGVEPEPFQLGEHLVEASGKLVLIDQLLTYLQPLGHKVLLFSQMTRMLDILQDYLGYRGINYERLDGSIRGEERYLAVQNFNSDDDTFVFLLSTKAGGVGLNLVSADTVIFVDSDFNPQNDLQAAARAHRIGQTRPVKIIRLVGRSTVEEVILKRAEAKLKLTETVIEKGNFSLGADANDKESLIASSKFQIQDILKFGVDKLFATDESTVENVDFDQILGRTKNGAWTKMANKEEQVSLAAASMDVDPEINDKNDNEKPNMYIYEGTDYSQLADDDMEAFKNLLNEKDDEEDSEEEENGRSRRKSSDQSGASLKKLRKKLTPEELEHRRKRRAELAAEREKEEEEEEKRRMETRKNRLLALWKKNNYTSCKIEMASSDEENSSEEEEEEEEEDGTSKLDINYVVGDVTKPKANSDEQAYVVHCVDDSGSWGSGGVFSALSSVSTEPEEQYELAGEMKDLSLGDVHLVPLINGNIYVALIIAQTRNRKGELTGIKLPALADALRYLAHAAKKNKASVHLPRIGHNTPGFNWYGTERLIRKYLISKGIKTSIYYFKRRQPVKRRIVSDSESESETPSKKVSRQPSPQPGTSKEPKPTSSPTPGPSSGSKPSTSPKKNLSQPSSCEDLPDFMSGVSVYFHGVPQSKEKLLSRYLIAYNGDVCSSISEDTTHIVLGKYENTKILQNIQNSKDEFPHMVITSLSWLRKCFKQQKKLDPT